MKYNVKISGTGSYLPENIVSNFDIERLAETSDAWIQSKLGIKERRVAQSEMPSDMGYSAALNALANAKMEKEDIDLIIFTTSSPEKILPSTACIIQNRLKLKKSIPAFDISAACSGFIYALNMVAPLVSMGVYRNVLIISAEALSRVTDWSGRQCMYFGDGAGAVVISKAENGWLCIEVNADGSGTGMTGFCLPLSEKFTMVGKEVWDKASSVIPQSVKSVLDAAGVSLEEVNMIIPHQPNINLLKNIAQSLGVPMGKVKTVVHKFANLASASIPVALHEAISEGEVKHGDTLVFTAIGSGWTWGSAVVKYDL